MNKFFESLYMMVFIIRRVVLSFIIVFLGSSEFWTKIIILALLQGFNFMYLIVLRPIAEIKDFIVEVFNEFIFIFLLGIIMFNKNEAENWTDF